MTTETENYHRIDITLYENTTIKTINQMANYGLIIGANFDLDDEFYITIDFKDLDEFLTFWRAFGKYIRTVWDNSEIGPKFHNYV